MKKILLIDDDAFIRDIVSTKLIDAGYEMVTASNGEVALEKLHMVHVDILLLDLDMPGLSGIDVLVQMKKEEELKNVPVIIFSNSNDAETVAKVKKLGAVDFYLKATTDIDDLIEKIETHTK